MTIGDMSGSFRLEELDEEKRISKRQRIIKDENDERERREKWLMELDKRGGGFCRTGWSTEQFEDWAAWKNDRREMWHLKEDNWREAGWNCWRQERQNDWWERRGEGRQWREIRYTQMKFWEEKKAKPPEVDWIHEADNDFALSFLKQINSSETLSQESASPKSCQTCTALSRHLKLSTSLSELSKSSETCKLCGILLQSFEDSSIPNEEKIQIFGDGSTLRMNCDGQPILRLCGGSGLEAGSRDIPIVYPILPDEKSPSRFKLFRQWLRTCDKQHRCFPGSAQLPTRVLEVLGHERADFLRLRCTKQGDTGTYVTLSHRWSNLDNFCTYQCNIRSRQATIDFKGLPKRFQDAITVTRQLGIQFLWIDSICIIQPHCNSSDKCSDKCRESNDWDIECGKMEEYFSSAYCTIAATSATNPQVNEGFLERRRYAQWIRNPETSKNPHHVSYPIDDFRRDVEDAELNKRGWVLQERALSRRIIHFTSTQAYWECGGDGIRCESLTKLRNPTEEFLSDHEFPTSLLRHFEGNRISLFQSLFEKYSRCTLTKPADRSVAIFGLEKRLGKTFNTNWRYGIFQRYQHRCLLWRRPDDQRIKRILPDTGNTKVPSWSWMAYMGEITYMKIPFEKVEWNEAIQCRLQAQENDSLGIELEAPAGELRLGETDEERGQLIFDEQDITDIERLRYIVIGRKTDRSDDEQEHYILVIIPSKKGSCEEYERVGVGSLKRRNLSSNCESVRVT